MEETETSSVQATAAVEADMTFCPFCREAIKTGSIKCRHCQSLLVPLNENTHQQPASIQQSVQVVTPPIAVQTRIVTPFVVEGDKMYARGVVQVLLSLLVISCGASNHVQEEDAFAALCIAIVLSAPLLYYIYDTLSKPAASKVMPAIALFFTIAGLTAAIVHL